VRGWLDGVSDIGNSNRDSELLYIFSASFITHFQILGFHDIDCEDSCLL
jgi:hypothetical protein